MAVPPVWTSQGSAACRAAKHTEAMLDQADIPTAAAAAAAPLCTLASSAQADLAHQSTADREPAAIVAASTGLSDAQLPQPVLRPVVRRLSPQASMLTSPPPGQTSSATQAVCHALASRVNAEPAIGTSALDQLPSGHSHALPDSGRLNDLNLPSIKSGLVRAPTLSTRPMQSVLRSPFAALANLPVTSQASQTATPVVPTSSCTPGHMRSKLCEPLHNTASYATANTAWHVQPATARLQLVQGQGRAVQQQSYCEAQQPQIDSPSHAAAVASLDKKACLMSRLPLSPSSIKTNGGEARMLQPVARLRSTALHSGSAAQGSSQKHSRALLQEKHVGDSGLGLEIVQSVEQSELLPGRNVVVSNACVHDLAHLQILPSQWCW